MTNILSAVGILFAISLAIFMGVVWGLWALWCWIAPQILPNASEALVSPSYWLFLLVAFLIKIVINVLFAGVRS